MKKYQFIDKGMDMRNIIIFVISILVATGIYGLTVMPKNEFPTFAMPQGLIIGVYPGATSQEVEDRLTKPLEDFIFSFKEFKKDKVVSQSRDGIVYIMVETDDDVKIDQRSEFWSKFKHSVALFKSSLPSGVLAVVVQDDFGDSSAILLTMESESKTYSELDDYMDDLKRRLRKVSSIANLKTSGIQKEQISIYLDQERMSSYYLNTGMVSAALMSSGMTLTGTSLEGANLTAPIHIESPISCEEDVAERIVYYSPDGKIVRLRDIATVVREYPEPTSYVKNNGTKAILLSMEMKAGNNIVQMGREVDAILKEFQSTLPEDVTIFRITDQSQVVGDSVHDFLKELLVAILSVIVVVILLLPVKVALVAASSIPITIFMSMALLYLAGMELNTVTLAALVITLGMIVDNSIVIIDSYMGKLDEGMPRRQASLDSAKQFFSSILAATLAISITFFPFLFMAKGMIADFITTFPWSTTIILFLSLLVAVFLIPTMQYFFIRKGLHTEGEAGKKRITDYVQDFFDRLIRGSFRHPGVTIAAGMMIIAGGLLLFAVIPQKMMPVAQRNQFAVEIYLQNGSTLGQTAAVARKLEEVLKKDERIVSITSFIGSSSPRFHTAYAPQMPGANYAQFIVNTTGNQATEDILNEYTPKYYDAFPEAVVRFRQLEYNDAANPVEIRLSCTDRDTLKKYVEQVKAVMRGTEDAIMVRDDYNGTVPGISMNLDLEAMDRFGVQTSMVSLNNLAKYSAGIPVGSIYEGDKEVNIMLKAGREGKPDASVMENERIAGYGGVTSVPLREIADIEPEWYDGQLVRRNGVPTATVMACMVRGGNSDRILKDIHRKLDKMYFPESITFQDGGDKGSADDIIPQMMKSLVMSLLVILFILVFHFRDLKTSFLVLGAIIIFSTPCTSISIAVMGFDLSVTCFMGIVSLMGIIARNAIIMIDYAHELMMNGESVKDAVRHSAERRMRPIFLTSAAASMGVVPMIIGGSTLWAPMGVVVFIGTWISMFLILTMFPVLYSKIASIPHKMLNENNE